MYHYGPHTAWLRAYWHLFPQKNTPKESKG
jgi:hypothetical protein